MLKKLFKRNEVLGEYFNGLKLIYQEDTLLIINYERIDSINSSEVILSKINVVGKDLKVIYQDPIKIKIKGKITTITLGE